MMGVRLAPPCSVATIAGDCSRDPFPYEMASSVEAGVSFPLGADRMPSASHRDGW